MAIIDRIKYDGPDDGSQWLIYKYPSEELVLGSQLIVNQGQEALFFKGGEALDLLGPGTHTLSTGNLPILNKLVKYPFGGKTPFAAEVYFINKTVNIGMNWGTSTPIPLEDPQYGLILHVGARGQYGISIVDSRLFVSRMVGAVPKGARINHLFLSRYFNGIINSWIKSITAGRMIKEKISFLEISQYLMELSDALKSKLDDQFERFGLELTNFYCVSIAPKPDEYKKLREYKEVLALGKEFGEEFYKIRRFLDIMEKLAENQKIESISNIDMGLAADGWIDRAFTRADPTASAECPHCGAKIPTGMRFCCECGKSLASAACPSCGFKKEPGAKFCGNCGQKF